MRKARKTAAEEDTKHKRARSLDAQPSVQTPLQKRRPVSEPDRQEASSSNVVAEAPEESTTPTLESDDADMVDFGTPESPEPAPCDAPGPMPEPRNDNRRRSRRRRPRVSREPTWIGSPDPTPCESPWP